MENNDNAAINPRNVPVVNMNEEDVERLGNRILQIANLNDDQGLDVIVNALRQVHLEDDFRRFLVRLELFADLNDGVFRDRFLFLRYILLPLGIEIVFRVRDDRADDDDDSDEDDDAEDAVENNDEDINEPAAAA